MRSRFTIATAVVFVLPIGVLSAVAIIVRLPLHFVVSLLDGVIKASVGLLRSWAPTMSKPVFFRGAKVRPPAKRPDPPTPPSKPA